MNVLLFLLPCPILILVSAVSLRRTSILPHVGAVLMWVQMGISLVVCCPHMGAHHPPAPVVNGFRLDDTAVLFVLLTTLVVTAALTHAVGFFRREIASEHPPSARDLRVFYLFTALFFLSMIGVVTADNLGFLWIAVEATTLTSAPLVYYHRSRTSLEAGWKYLIICSVGIAFAFFGTAIFYAASQRVSAFGDGSLSVSELTLHARLLSHGMLRLGFVFTLLGYGTKAGLFPLHSWLPDAHSEAPAPASAMLSGALLNCALVALWRTSGLMVAAGEGVFIQTTLLPMGVVTVLAASLFLLKQRDLKRMLAYSSMENVGLMAVAIALGTGSGFALQAINHSLVKVALFLLAGNLLQQYGTKTIREIRGVMIAQPSQAVLLLLGAIAVAGTPPFGSFLAEWQILSVAADAPHIAVVFILCAALAIAFIALSMQFAGIVFGETPAKKAGASESPPGPPVRDSSLAGTLCVIPGLLLTVSLLLGMMLTPAAFAIVLGVAR
jgi:hydrogenase-4 component F